MINKHQIDENQSKYDENLIFWVFNIFLNTFQQENVKSMRMKTP